MSVFNTYFDELTALPTARDRYAKLRKDWDSAFDAAQKVDITRNLPMGANTYSATLLTEFLVSASITKLQNRWAALKLLSRQFSTDRYKPLAPAELKFTTSGAAAQTDPTSFEPSSGSTISGVKLTPHQISVSFNVSNTELASGLRLDDLVTANLRSFGDAVLSAAMAPVTAANFTTNPPLLSAPTSFSWCDMRALWGSLKKSDVKNAILDGEYYSQLLNTPTQLQRTGPGRWEDFQWDNIEQCTNWTGADPNVRGFACNPQAIALLAGLPLSPPVARNALTEQVFTVPELDISAAIYSWMALQSRTAWVSLDIIFGASLLDESAGVLIKSA